MTKKSLAILILTLLTLALVMTGCGDKCTTDDSRACTTTYTSCTSSCNPVSSTYKTCTETCKKSYCDCLDSAGCDTSASGGTC